MKALQNLIPNSNKVCISLVGPVYPTIHLDSWLNCLIFLFLSLFSFSFPQQTDKASMLDEAIEYLKQLQLQVQVYTSPSIVNFI